MALPDINTLSENERALLLQQLLQSNNYPTLNQQIDEHLYRQITENIREAFWVTDAESNVIYVSPWCEEIWGISAESLAEKPDTWTEYIHPDDLNRVVKAYKNLRTETFDEEYRIVRPNGEIRYIRDRAFPIYDKEGDLYRVVGVALDITHRKQSETQQLSKNRQLTEQAKYAVLEETTVAIAHQLHQPLTSIVQYIGGCIERLKAENVSPEITAAMREAMNEAERAGQIIYGMRAYLSNKNLEKTKTQVDTLIYDALHPYSRDLNEHDITYDLSIEKNIGSIYVDSIQMEQAIGNIVQNAIDAMLSQSSHSHRLSINVTKKNHANIEICITDSGPGINESCHKKMFEPFFSSKSQGLGMGLPIARSIIQMHDGTIDVINTPEGGAQFFIRLPLPTSSQITLTGAHEIE